MLNKHTAQETIDDQPSYSIVIRGSVYGVVRHCSVSCHTDLVLARFILEYSVALDPLRLRGQNCVVYLYYAVWALTIAQRDRKTQVFFLDCDESDDQMGCRDSIPHLRVKCSQSLSRKGGHSTAYSQVLYAGQLLIRFGELCAVETGACTSKLRSTALE